MRRKVSEDKVLSALVTTDSIALAAKKANVSETTIYRYLSDPPFKSRYREARKEIVESSIACIQTAMQEAIEALRRNLNCESPSVEVRAAQIILDLGVKGVEIMDIAERLEVLEAEMADGLKRGQ